MDLKGKKILLLAPDFFGYDLAIKEKLESFGASIFLYNERPSSNVFIKAIIRVKKDLIKFYSKRYFLEIINNHRSENFDYIFVIKGEVINKEILSFFKKQYKQATFILYMWDSIKNYNSTKEALPLYDHAFTFDKNDVEQYSEFKFRPLFFIDTFDASKYSQNYSNEQNDLLFIGTVHSDRWIVISKIIGQVQKLKLKFFYYPFIQSPLIFILRKIFDKKLMSLPFKDVKFHSLSKEKTANYILNSKIIIDIQHPNQTGLTMRTIEILGMRKKLITTNKIIEQYDFFNNNNILVVDREYPVLLEEFINLKYEEIDSNILIRYSLEGWIKEIFENLKL
jgi:hypothetical protein